MNAVMKSVGFGLFLGWLLLSSQIAAAQAPYSIVDGKVDAGTFQGWLAYQRGKCGSCHGDSGQGGSAPTFVGRPERVERTRFTQIVTSGRGLMPPFSTNKDVIDHLDNIYSYVKARSDRALGEGTPLEQ